MQNDLYISLGYLIVIGFALTLTFLVYKKFEISVVFYALSTWIAAFYFTNEEIWLNTEVETGIQGYLRAGLLVMIGIIGYFNFFTNRYKNNFKVPIHLIVLGIFLIYSLLSFIYSLDPRYTLIRSGIFIFTLGFFLSFDGWLNKKESFEKILNLIFYIFISILTLSLLVTLISPERVWWWQQPNRFIGIGTHPADIGSVSMLFYPIILWKINKGTQNQKVLLYLLLFVVFVLHFLTGSRTTLIAAVFGYFLWIILNMKWIKLLVSLIIFLILASMLTIILPSSMQRSESEGLLFLSSRELIWNGAYTLFWDKPLTGYGYRVEAKIFENQQKYDTSDKFFIASAQQPLHSGYLSIAIGGGLIGLFLWLFALFYPIVRSFTTGMNEIKSVLISMMITILITNITETALTGYQGLTDVFFWITWIMAGKIWRLEESSENS